MEQYGVQRLEDAAMKLVSAMLATVAIAVALCCCGCETASVPPPQPYFPVFVDPVTEQPR
jgi:hypothetical protein